MAAAAAHCVLFVRFDNLTKDDVSRISECPTAKHREEEPRRFCADSSKVGPLIRRAEYAPCNDFCLGVFTRFHARRALLHVQRGTEHLVDAALLIHAGNEFLSFAGFGNAEAPTVCHLRSLLHADTDLADDVFRVDRCGGAGHLV